MDHCCRNCGHYIDPVSSTATVTCNGPCLRRFHPECAGFANLSVVQISYLLWFCDRCQQDDGGLPLSLPELKQIVQKVCREGRRGGVDGEAEGVGDGLELPTEVLEMVFRKLNSRQLLNVRRTCHRWKDVVDGSPVLRRKFHLLFPEGVIMDRDFEPECLLPVAGVLIKQARIVTVDPWWSSLGWNLVMIVLEDCLVSLPELANMLRQAPNVKSLMVKDLYCPETYDVAKAANFELDQMECLLIKSCGPLIRDLLGTVCKRLKIFHFCDVEEAELTFEPDADEILEYVEKWQRTLIAITLTPSESMLSALGTLKDLQLTSLSLMCTFTGIGQLMPFLQLHPNLVKLVLLGITLTDTILCDIARILPSLEELAVERNRVSDWDMSFLNNMSKLKSFQVTDTFSYLDDGQDDDNDEETDAFASFHGCRSPKLQELNLFGLQPSEWDDFYHYLKTAPNLRSVTLQAYSITSWSDLFETLPMTQLRSLSLAQITHVSDWYVDDSDSLVEYYKNLRCLKLDHVAIDDYALKTLLRLCPHLETISLSRIETLNDDAMLVLCQKLDRLQELSIQECPITDASIGFIIAHCNVLERLDIVNCSGLTTAVRDVVVKSRLNAVSGKIAIAVYSSGDSQES